MPEKQTPPYRESDLSNKEQPDQQIVAAFIAGDMQAFKYVYNKYRERIFSYCLYVTGNKTRAEDAFQEVFIRIYQRREQLREAKALKSWMLMIARSVCLNLTRESVFTPDFIYLDDELHSNQSSADRHGVSVGEHEFPEEIFQIAFNKIAPIYRDAFLLREIEGFSSEEVAELTGTSVVNVKVRVMRAKRMLRGILAPHFKNRLETINKKAIAAEEKKESHKTEEDNVIADKSMTTIQYE